MDSFDRRQLMTGAAVLAGATAVAACGGSSNSASSSAAEPASSASSAPAPASSSGQAGPGAVVAQTTDVPVGGGIIVESGGQNFAVTQPAAGTFACFSAVCPHQGCNCNQVADGTIDCPCHGSAFTIATGAVVKGPATTGLTPAPITVTGTDISLV